MLERDTFLEKSQAHVDGVGYSLEQLLMYGDDAETQERLIHKLMDSQVLDLVQHETRNLVAQMCITRAIEAYNDIQEIRDLEFYDKADWE